MSTTDPTAETLPNPFTCTVDIRKSYFGIHEVWLNFVAGHLVYVEQGISGFPTKEEADAHAALILSALHEAVME